MTPSYFINTESLTFDPGQIIVVSGPDSAATLDMLLDARDAIITAGTGCLDPVDTRMTTIYPDGLVISGYTPTTTKFATHSYVSLFENLDVTMVSGANSGLVRRIQEYDRASNVMTVSPAFPSAPAIGDGFCLNPVVERAFKFEYFTVAYRAAGPTPKVVLVSNQFDREDLEQNPVPRSIDIDVVIDLLNLRNVENIPMSHNLNYGHCRELFSYISKLYYFDDESGTVTFVKDQIPQRP